MNAYLIYRREEAEKNKRFITLFQEAGRECGINFCYVPHDKYKEVALPDFVLNRTRDADVSRWYEKRQVPVFHSSHITEIGNHKGRTIAFLKESLPKEVLHEKWVPETFLITKENLAVLQTALEKGSLNGGSFEESGRPEGFAELERFQREERAFVIKSVDGHGGSEVMGFLPLAMSEWRNEPEQYWKNLGQRLSFLSGKDCILQEMIPGGGRDVRVYILGNRIYQAMMRQGQGDFRSNASLGGRTELYTLSAGEKKYVEVFLQAFQSEVLGLAGLDFILSGDGRLVFNELEEMAGCRMLYQNTDKNIVRDYVFWLRDSFI